MASVNLLNAQIYTQNFNAVTVGLGTSGNNAASCDGSMADGTVTQTLGNITWLLTGSFTGGGATADACDYVKIVQKAAGNRRIHAKDLNGNKFRYRLSGVNTVTGIDISGLTVTVNLLVGVEAGTLEPEDSVIVQVIVDGSPAYTQAFTGNFANQNLSLPGFIGDELFLDVYFRNGDPGGATGESETHFLDNISITGTPCQPALTITGENNPCPGTTETYSITSPPAGHDFTWSVSGFGTVTPSVDGTSAEVEWASNATGARTVIVEDHDPLTGCTTTNTYNVSVLSAPSVSPISDIGPFCPDANVNAISMNTNPFSTSATMSWTVSNPVTGAVDGSDGAFPYEFPAFVTTNTTGSQQVSTVSVVATSSAGCAGPAEEFTITVNPKPDLVLNGTPTMCFGETFDLGTLINSNLLDGEVVDQNSIPSLGFLVYNSMDFIPANQVTNLMVSPASTKTYYFVKPTASGCNDFIDVELVVQGPVTISDDPDNAVICSGDNAVFAVTAANGGDGDLIFQWQVSEDGMSYTDVTDGGVYSGATTDELTITGASVGLDGNYYQVLVSTSECAPQTSAAAVLTVKPRPALQTDINGVVVTDNNDGADDTGSFSVCDGVSPNLFFNAFTDLAGVLQDDSVRVIQEFVRTNVNFSPTDGIFPLSSFSPSFSQTVSLVDPSENGTLVMRFRVFFDANNDGLLDPGDCPGDWIVYTVTVGEIPEVTASADLPFGGGIYAACSGEEFTISLDGTGNPVGTTYSAEWTRTILFGTPDTNLVVGAGDFANKPTTPTTSTSLTGSFVNPDPNMNSVQIDMTITATTPQGCTGTYSLVIYLRPEIFVTSVTGLPATVCSGESTPAATVNLNLSGGTRSITWAWSGTDVTAAPPTGGPDNSAPFTVGATSHLNLSGDPRTDTLTVFPLLSYDTPVAQQCPGDGYEVVVTVDPGPLVESDTLMACSDAPIGVIFGASTNLVAVNTYNVSVANDGGLTPSAGPTTGSGLGANAIAADAWHNTTGMDVNVEYSVVPVSLDGCLGPAFTVLVTVKAEPVVPFQSGDMACSDEPIGVTLGNSNPFVSAFNITAIDPNGLTASAGSPTTGTGFTDDEIEDDAWTNITSAPVNVIYTVVPISLQGCPGDFFTVTVMIKPEPVVEGDTLWVCSDQEIGVVFNDDPDGPSASTYTITGLDVDAGLTPAVTNLDLSSLPLAGQASVAVIADKYNNVTADTLTVTYYVVPLSSDGCAGDTFAVKVIINPEPVVADQTAAVCSDEEIGVTLGDDADGPDIGSYTIVGLDIDPGLVSDPGNFDLSGLPTPVGGVAAGDISADAYTNTTGDTLTVTYSVIPVSINACEGDTFTVVVTVYPEPVVDNVPLFNVCSDDAIGYMVPATSVNGLTITSFDVTATVDPSL
ncbi:MAG TPA: hypothetical protein PKE06_17930, partial [Flavilitoribacter sp.]|nr:hypothetical protein [Flavilitoribacter sp.]